MFRFLGPTFTLIHPGGIHSTKCHSSLKCHQQAVLCFLAVVPLSVLQVWVKREDTSS